MRCIFHLAACGLKFPLFRAKNHAPQEIYGESRLAVRRNSGETVPAVAVVFCLEFRQIAAPLPQNRSAGHSTIEIEEVRGAMKMQKKVSRRQLVSMAPAGLLIAAPQIAQAEEWTD